METLTLSEIITFVGKEPDFSFDTPQEELEKQEITDSVAYKYVIFITDKASGGCIIYGEYGNGDAWIANPSLRYVVRYLLQNNIAL